MRLLKHGVTVEDVLAVMPNEKDETNPHYEDSEILKDALKAGSTLSEVSRVAREVGGSGYEGDLIDWIAA